MPIFSSTTVDRNSLNAIFRWAEFCNHAEEACMGQLKVLIKNWPADAKPAQLKLPQDSDITWLAGSDKLGVFLADKIAKAKVGTDPNNNNRVNAELNYDLLVHVHNHDYIGKFIDPQKKWGKTLNMGGIPGIGVGSRITRGITSVVSAGDYRSGGNNTLKIGENDYEDDEGEEGEEDTKGGTRYTRKHRSKRSKKTRRH
jgi:hypothetical protein